MVPPNCAFRMGLGWLGLRGFAVSGLGFRAFGLSSRDLVSVQGWGPKIMRIHGHCRLRGKLVISKSKGLALEPNPL